MRRILVVDDEREMRIAIFEALSRKGFDVSVADSGQVALDLVRNRLPELVVTDIRMPGMDGLELLRRLRDEHRELPVIVITGYGTVDSAVDAMKLGAAEYLLKPFSMAVIEETVMRVLANRDAARVLAEPGQSRTAEAGREGRRPIIGRDEKFLRILDKARKVASSKATVLILGESGTGKEVLARFIHNESDRCQGPFVALNCAALPEGLLESELFGHERGAFTGAISLKKGKFELADRGTLLLDEIGEIPLHLQAKLLRVLQEEEVDRLGAKAPIKVDAHVIATTNRALDVEVKEGRFREDLFYRLNVIPLRLPPLRERRDDLLLLSHHFVEKFAARHGKPVRNLTAAVETRFLAYHWPGNVREMENLIERAVLLAVGNELTPFDFWEEEFPEMAGPASVREEEIPAAPATVTSTLTTLLGGEITPLRDAERQLILQALHRTDNNRTHAARLLGVSVRTLRNKLHEYRCQGEIDEISSFAP